MLPNTISRSQCFFLKGSEFPFINVSRMFYKLKFEKKKAIQNEMLKNVN